MSESATVRTSFPQTAGNGSAKSVRVTHEDKQRAVSKAKKIAPVLVQCACEELEITRMAFYSKSRARRLAYARKIVSWLMRNHPDGGFSYPVIGEVLGKDHTTIMDGCCEIREAIIAKRREVQAVQRICNRVSFHGLKPMTVRADK